MEKILENKGYTGITFEIFNSCSGSCTGCMLSSLEKKDYDLDIDTVLLGLKKISEYQATTDTKYRVVFSFADIPKIPWDKQEIIYKECLKNNLQFGLTLTLTDDKFDYFGTLDKIHEINPKTVIDLTIDPVRLLNPKFKKYQENVVKLIQGNFNRHLQILLSSYILDSFKANELYEKITPYIGNHGIFLGFSPTIQKFNSEKLQQYSFDDALRYSQEFYSSSQDLKEFIGRELDRNDNYGSYADFTKLVFHIDTNLNVYNQIYSLYGDLIQDQRNFLNSLGNLRTDNLLNILNTDQVKKASIKNQLYLVRSPYDCEDCEHFDACNYNGIGLALNLYQSNNKKLTSCYGPKSFKV